MANKRFFGKPEYETYVDRRGQNRFKVGALATLITENNLEKPAIIRNLCTRGAGLEVSFSISLSKPVTVVLIISILEQIIKTNAQVVWCTKVDEDCWHIGLDFGQTHLLKF